MSQKLLLALNESGLIHMVPSMVNDLYIIRFAVCAKHATDEDMQKAFRIIQEHADTVIAEYRAQRSGRQSLSNDSLELSNKQVSTTNLTEDTSASVEEINPQVQCETATNVVKSYSPINKIRVKNYRNFDFFQRRNKIFLRFRRIRSQQ